MGIFNWLQRRGLAGMIPRNAVEQYNKWKLNDSSLSEGEIAQGIFTLRYVSAILDPNEQVKLISYFDSEFECETLMDFCLTSLDIEGGIDPSDRSAFFNTSKIIEEELNRLGFMVGYDHVDSFIGRWSKQVLTFRD